MVKQDVIDLGHGHQLLLHVEQVDGHRAEGASEFDHPCPGRHVGQAWCQETDVHVGGRQSRIRTGAGQNRKAGRTVGEGHQQPAVKGFEDTVVFPPARNAAFAIAVAEPDNLKLQRLNDRDAVDSGEKGVLQLGQHTLCPLLRFVFRTNVHATKRSLSQLS
jgi:hypothetical protein